MAWTKFVGGRLESRYQYSIGINYNPFPWPNIGERDKLHVDGLASKILTIRTHYADSTLADLYGPNTMPKDLRRAHSALDAAVDKLYRSAPFESDRERVEYLFGLYEKVVAPLIAPPRKSRGRVAAPATAI